MLRLEKWNKPTSQGFDFQDDKRQWFSFCITRGLPTSMLRLFLGCPLLGGAAFCIFLRPSGALEFDFESWRWGR